MTFNINFCNSGWLNDIWILSLPEQHLPPLINNTTTPLIDCSSDNSNSDECTLQCERNTSTLAGGQTPCLIDEDVIVNGSILENPTIAIVAVINVTGDVRITGNVTVKYRQVQDSMSESVWCWMKSPRSWWW